MAGTIEGGKRAAATNKKKYGKGFYADIGSIGGKKGRTGGFYTKTTCKRVLCKYQVIWGKHNVNRCAGAKGGRISRR